MSKVFVKLNNKKQDEAEVKEKWPEAQGQLTVDVYQTDNEIVVRSPIAGVKPEDLNISFEGDMLIIEGRREESKEVEKKNYFFRECFWGVFSRKIILPEEAETSRAEAVIKQGILTIRMPKREKEKADKITIKEEE